MTRTAVILAATVLAIGLASGPRAQRGGVPAEADLLAARDSAMRVLVERVVHTSGGDRAAASTELMAAAFEARDRATRYLLWQEAIRLAGESGNVWLAMQHQQCLCGDFDLDPVDSGVALLRRLADEAGSPEQHAAIGLAGLQKASAHGLEADERAMLSFYDVALRATLRADNVPLYGHVRDQLAVLRATAVLAGQLAGSMFASPFPRNVVAGGLLQGEVRMLEPFALRDLAGAFDGFGELALDRDARSLSADELIALGGHARHGQLARGLLRCALQRRLRDYTGAHDAARREICTAIVAIAERLCRLDGFSRLRFGQPDQREQLAFRNGDWRVEDGRLVGKAIGSDNFATHRIRYASANVVVIRGGIRSPDGLNFRCKVGDLNLLLNWEVEPQNHLWQNGACRRKAPHALTAGEPHTIAVFSDGATAHVCIDGEHWWSATSQLRGTVSVYPALGSEIFVDEILVDGVPEGLGDDPIGVMM